MYVAAVSHHYLVNKCGSGESRLIKPGCTVLVAVAGGLCWNKRQKDEGDTECQGGRAWQSRRGSSHARRRSKTKERKGRMRL